MNPELSLKLQTLYKLPVCITKEKISDSVAALRTGIPRFKNARDMLRSPGNIERPSIDKHKHNRFACSFSCFEKFLLFTRQVERGARSAFAAHALELSEHEHGQVR